MARDRRVKHGMAGSPIYKIWESMIKRCHNPNSQRYKYYGARGISVCEEWRGEGGFQRFYDAMGSRPEGYTLDRIDPSGDYTPENCRWASWTTQNRNRRNSVSIRVGHVTRLLVEWAEWPTTPTAATIRSRLANGWEPIEAVFGDRNRVVPDWAMGIYGPVVEEAWAA